MRRRQAEILQQNKAGSKEATVSPRMEICVFQQTGQKCLRHSKTELWKRAVRVKGCVRMKI